MVPSPTWLFGGIIREVLDGVRALRSVGEAPHEREPWEAPLASPELPCHGCAHSASGAPFPGHPSGERPCLFCVRNPSDIAPERLRPRSRGVAELTDDEKRDERTVEYVRKASRAPEGAGIWYDGTPAFKTPMDCYVATDRFQQQRIFEALERYEREGRPIPERESYGTTQDGRAWCCEGGDGPKGHTWTCWRWLGVSVT